MNRICPITYENCGNNFYSKNGLKAISRSLNKLNFFPYSAEEQREESVLRASKMSIQGVQPKISGIISPKDSNFIIVDKNGTFIIKPQNLLYKHLPENEDLTMRLASTIGLSIPLHGLIYCKDESFSYFIKRFDRINKAGKVPVEDFAQLSGKNRETKYASSMEKVTAVIETYCTFPQIEKLKLFKVVLFNFLVGNEDHHLKNFSVIRSNQIVEISPFYDLVNTTIALKNPTEEIALPINGKQKNISNKLLINYFGKERLGLNEKIINNTLTIIKEKVEKWPDLITRSFLPDYLKEKYKILLDRRRNILF